MRQNYQDHLLGERYAKRVLKLYGETFGSIMPLLSNGDSQHRDQVERRSCFDLQGVSSERLRALSQAAIRHLAAEDSRRSGRTPLRPSDWRVIRYSLLSARTLREAIAHCTDSFEAIDWRCGRMSLRTRGDTAELELNAMRSSRGLAACLIDLSGIAGIHALLQWLIDQPLPIRYLSLDQDLATYEGLELPELPFPLRANQSWTGFSFGFAYLDYPVVRSKDEIEAPPLGSFLFKEEMPSPNGTCGDKVRAIALKRLRNFGRLPGFDELAAEFVCSASTLRRHLAREGTTYRDIRDSCRREIALDLLRNSSLAIEEISARIDFCDSDAFRRAFQRWLGASPSKYRRDSLAVR